MGDITVPIDQTAITISSGDVAGPTVWPVKTTSTMTVTLSSRYLGWAPLVTDDYDDYKWRKNSLKGDPDLNNFNKEKNKMIKDEHIYLVKWNKKEGLLNEDTITVLGRVTDGNITQNYDHVAIATNDLTPVKYFKGPKEISLTATISDSVWDTGDFAVVLQKLGHYAKIGADTNWLESLNFIKTYKPNKFAIKKVVFSGPCTIVFWEDGTKTMVRAQGDELEDKEKGLAMAITKRVYGDKPNYNNIFKRWIYGAEWKKKERKVKKAIKLAKKNGDLAEADILKNSMEKNLDYTFAMAKTYLQDSKSTPLEKVLKTVKDKIGDALSFDFQGKRKDLGVIDEAKDSDDEE